MTANDVLPCAYCGAIGRMRQVCSEKCMSDGVPFSCTRCGGAFFQRTVSSVTSDEYWEGDPVNEQVYALPEVHRAFSKKYERYLRRVDHMRRSGKTLLEVGCGSGIFLGLAARWGWIVHGLDISPQAVEMTKRFCPDATVICAPLEKSGFNPETFDLVALWDVIEHVDDPEAVLNQVRYFLRPGGMVILETPDEGCLPRTLVRFLHNATRGRMSMLRAFYYPAHRWYFSRRAMAKVLRRVGFDQIQFYRERTVREFGERKCEAYGLLGIWPQRIFSASFQIMKMIPVLRNKMVVMAVKC